MNSIYDYSIESIDGSLIDLNNFRGSVLLLVNTASYCGYTPQYEGLQTLYSSYKDKGLVIIAFPCNQFGGQEPDDQKTIASSCLVNYGVTFPVTKKIEVNGANAHPIFSYLKSNLKGIFNTEDIKWNFTKFLISRDGSPYKRYSPTDTPADIESDILKLL